MRVCPKTAGICTFTRTIPPVRLAPNHLPLHKGGMNLIFRLTRLLHPRSSLHTGDPFPQCAHWGLPLEGAALRGKGLRLARLLLRALLAPLIGELAAKPTEGLPELRYCH